MRFDRILTLLRAKVLGSWAQSSSSTNRRLPVLMYHSLSEDREDVGDYYKLCTGPRRFKDQMGWLKESGYHGVSLKKGLAWLRGETDVQLPPQTLPVAITFDDAFRDFFTAGLDSLKEHGFSATMYVPTSYIAQDRRRFLNRECMTWDELQTCYNLGIELGSHTHSHPFLYGLAWSEIENEFTTSKEILQHGIQASVDAIAYPYAFPFLDRPFVARLAGILQQHGYRTCTTTQVGRFNTRGNPLEIPRLPVNSADDRKLLLAKLSGNYDWVGSAQRFVKFGKTIRYRKLRTAQSTES